MPSPGGPLSPGEGAAILAHFFEQEDTSDQDDFLTRVMAAGIKRRMDILRAIFARCSWEGECLVWDKHDSGTGRGGGYGRFSFEGVTASVHRVVYACVYGPIPNKKQVDHECNNRKCCNPFHLKHTTHKRNQKLRDARRSATKA